MPKDFMSSKITTGGGGDFGGGGATGYFGTAGGSGAGAGRGFINPTSVNTTGAGRGQINPPMVDAQNAFVHETNNTSASAQSSQSAQPAKFNLNIKFQPNILDNYDSYTYHWKLFIVDPESASLGKVLDLNNQTIIAESGVSDLTIDKVEILSTTGPNIQTGTGTSNFVNFEIVEPAGAGLIDKIYYQSFALGIGSWVTMPFYLQLQFRGRDQGSSEALTDGAPGELSSLKWIWAIRITDMKANVTTVGTRYNVTAIFYDELAQSNAYFTLQNSLRLSNLTTFGSAMAELENKLNADQLLKLIGSYSVPDIFKIVVDPKLAVEKITPINNSTDSIKSNNMSNLEFKDGSYNAGTAIDKVIDSILSSIPSLQAEFVGANVPGQQPKQRPSQIRPFWRIITESRPTKFDPRRQANAHEFTIFVVKYDLGIVTPDSVVGATLTVEEQRNRIQELINKRILKKKYNYIFTGLNNQIINLDLTLNNAFSIAQSRIDGIYSNLAMASKGRVMQDNSVEEGNITKQVNAAISLNNSAMRSGNAINDKAITDAKTAVQNSGLSEDTKNKYIVLLNNSKPERRSDFQREVISRGGLNNDGSLNTARTRATNLAKPQTETVTGQQLRFISDVNPSSRNPQSQQVFADYLDSVRGKLRPIARNEQMQDKQAGMGIESSSNSGIQKFSSLFSIALHGGVGNSFQILKLTIKGDPFWLFPQPIVNDNERPFYNSLKPQNEAIEWIKRSQFRLNDSANYYGTDNFLLIRFRTPRIFNIEENDNDVDAYSEVETFSGIYKVTEVKNIFSAGKFTQEINCILDTESDINMIDFTDQIENNAATLETPTTTRDLITTNPLPTTAIKNTRIDNTTTPRGILALDLTNTNNVTFQQGQQAKNLLRGK